MTVPEIWWATLSVVAVVNMALWLRTYARPETHGPQLWLSAGFTFGCAFRSIFPRADVQRIVMVDHWISSVAIGRSVATIAELCFMAQLALALRGVADDVGARRVALATRFVVPMIAFAECNSWWAVVTTNYLGNVIEESTWAITGALLTGSLALVWKRLDARTKRLLWPALLVGVGYVAFMGTVDVPMYATRFLADQAAGKAYLPFFEGLHDVATRWRVTHALAEWREEMPWMGLYFSVSVWVSLALANRVR